MKMARIELDEELRVSGERTSSEQERERTRERERKRERERGVGLKGRVKER